jgi:hypothetical protein
MIRAISALQWGFIGWLLGVGLAIPASADQGAAPGAAVPPAAPTFQSVRIERDAGRFSVSGRLIEREQTQGPQLLEYLVVKKGGLKSYEALLELDTTATEFNLACILIGLDASHAVLPRYHFDPEPAKGDPVTVFVEWDQDGAPRQVPASELLVVGAAPVTDNDWVYTGSIFNPPRYLAEESGTLIGFIHDRDSIIEHRSGIGLGSGTRVSVNTAVLPPPGTPIRVIVQRPAGSP